LPRPPELEPVPMRSKQLVNTQVSSTISVTSTESNINQAYFKQSLFDLNAMKRTVNSKVK
jgi:hypothetical protein